MQFSNLFVDGLVSTSSRWDGSAKHSPGTIEHFRAASLRACAPNRIIKTQKQGFFFFFPAKVTEASNLFSSSVLVQQRRRWMKPSVAVGANQKKEKKSPNCGF